MTIRQRGLKCFRYKTCWVDRPVPFENEIELIDCPLTSDDDG